MNMKKYISKKLLVSSVINVQNLPKNIIDSESLSPIEYIEARKQYIIAPVGLWSSVLKPLLVLAILSQMRKREASTGDSVSGRIDGR